MAGSDISESLWRTFDAAWYQHRYPVEGGHNTPEESYAAFRKSRRHSPNPYFCEIWYLARYRDVRDQVERGHYTSGFDHYCKHGYSTLMPHWLFDPAHYRAQFARGYSTKPGPDADDDPYEHYLRIGQHRGLSGHWLCDPAVYATRATFDIASRIRSHGPHTTFLLHIASGAPEPVVSNLFDPVWYATRYASVLGEGKWSCGLHHYLTNDDPVAFDPAPNFSDRRYLAAYPDVAAAVRDGAFRNGFHHFELHGRKEGRFTEPAGTADTVAADILPARLFPSMNFPLRTQTFYDVTFLSCRPDPLKLEEDATFGILGNDGNPLREFKHSWIDMRTGGEPTTHLPGCFIYGGVLTPHFGHILRDGLATLWFIRRHPELPVLWYWLDLPVPHDEWPGWLDQIWQILGLDKHRHHRITDSITVDQVILPEPGLMALNVLHKSQALALALRSPPTEWKGNRVWLSRSALPDQFGRIEREAEVETILARRGWTILHPETLPVAEQTDIFGTAAVVAGCIGSAFHALLLSTAPRAKLILVHRPGIEHTYYDAVARALDLDQHHIQAVLEPFSDYHPWAHFTFAAPLAVADQVHALADTLT